MGHVGYASKETCVPKDFFGHPLHRLPWNRSHAQFFGKHWPCLLVSHQQVHSFLIDIYMYESLREQQSREQALKVLFFFPFVHNSVFQAHEEEEEERRTRQSEEKRKEVFFGQKKRKKPKVFY